MMPVLRNLVCAAMALGLAVASATAAEVYRWTDEQGNVHYSNDPADAPPDAKAEDLPHLSGQSRPSGQTEEEDAHRDSKKARSENAARIAYYDLRRQHQRVKQQLDDVEQSLAALSPSTPVQIVGDANPGLFEERSREAKDLYARRDQLTKRLHDIEERSADLRRQVMEANDGRVPSWWEDLTDTKH